MVMTYRWLSPNISPHQEHKGDYEKTEIHALLEFVKVAEINSKLARNMPFNI